MQKNKLINTLLIAVGVGGVGYVSLKSIPALQEQLEKLKTSAGGGGTSVLDRLNVLETIKETTNNVTTFVKDGLTDVGDGLKDIIPDNPLDGLKEEILDRLPDGSGLRDFKENVQETTQQIGNGLIAGASGVGLLGAVGIVNPITAMFIGGAGFTFGGNRLRDNFWLNNGVYPEQALSSWFGNITDNLVENNPANKILSNINSDNNTKRKRNKTVEPKTVTTYSKPKPFVPENVSRAPTMNDRFLGRTNQSNIGINFGS